MTLTPEFEKAIQLTEQQHFLELASELGRVKTQTTNKYAANGQLRSGAFLGALVTEQLAAITNHANAVVDSYVRLASKAGLLSRPDTKAWLTTRLEGFLSNKGFLNSLSEQAKLVRIPHERVHRGRRATTWGPS